MNIWTWANLLTAYRLMIALPCAWAIAQQYWTMANVLFITAVLSDLYDGIIARKLRQASALGGLLDHFTDAAFVTLGLAAFSRLSQVPILLPILIMASFTQYMLDSKALSGHTLRSSLLGKWNGIGYFVLLGIGVIGPPLSQMIPAWPGSLLLLGFSWLLIISTGLSMLERALALIRSRV